MSVFRILAILAIAGLAFSAAAQEPRSTKRIDKRQDYQERRIDRGEKAGQLTQKEAARLEKGQDRVQKMESKAVADGKMSKKERAKIEKAQDRQSARIHRERHDKQTAK